MQAPRGNDWLVDIASSHLSLRRLRRLRRFLPVLSAFLVASATELTATRAHAQYAAPQVVVTFYGPRLDERARLEEQARNFQGADGWETLCEIPCTTRATIDPFARHRVVSGSTKLTVKLTGSDGEHVFVRFESRSQRSITVMLASGGLATSGLLVLLASMFAGLRTMGPDRGDPCKGTSSCDTRNTETDERSEIPATMLKAGLIGFGVGTLGLILGGLMSRTSVTVGRVPPRPETTALQRGPFWTQVELPRPPLHVPLVDLRF